MAMGILRFGLLIFVIGFCTYFFSHSDIATSVVCSLGFLIFVAGVTLWGLESSGDISLS